MIRVVRAVEQTGAFENACSKTIPASASFSIFGVGAPFLSKSLRKCLELSSEMSQTKFGFSAAPLVLGLILGPIAEANFIQGSQIAAAQDGPWIYFFTGPLNMFLIALVVASVLYSFWGNMVTGKPAKPVADGEAAQ